MSHLSTYILTFNCGRALVNPSALSNGFFNALADNGTYPDIIVLCLEEIAPIAYAYLGGSFLAQYFTRFLETVKIASQGKQTYCHLLSRNVGMTGILIFTTPTISDDIKWVETAGVGVGVMEMGNKGAVGIRLGLLLQNQEQVFDLTFVAAHLAPMEEAVQRRNQDWENIVRGMAFTRNVTGLKLSRPKRTTPADDDEIRPLLSQSPTIRGMFATKTALFFAGDLNYRSSDVSPGPRDVLNFPQPTTDMSNPLHFSHLLQSDQLTREKLAGRTLHHLSEASVNFPPTYKYSDKQFELMRSQSSSNILEEPSTYLWASHRYPSWTDRILFSSFLKKGRTPSISVHKYTALPIQPTSDHRPVAISLVLNLDAAFQASEEFSVEAESPFPINPDWQSQRAWARRREILVGLGAYLSTSWEGRGLVVAILVGSLGGWLVLGSLLEGWS